MRHHTRPDHTDPKANAGLRRRLVLRRQAEIDHARARGDHATAERLAADWLDRDTATVARAAERARDGAAALALLPLGERIGRTLGR